MLIMVIFVSQVRTGVHQSLQHQVFGRLGALQSAFAEHDVVAKAFLGIRAQSGKPMLLLLVRALYGKGSLPKALYGYRILRKPVISYERYSIRYGNRIHMYMWNSF
uniref:Secreted protein n=1 Tax=Steinernema glaseri TaxID=37863 RepID=A0A1I8ARU6_9BILA